MKFRVDEGVVCSSLLSGKSHTNVQSDHCLPVSLCLSLSLSVPSLSLTFTHCYSICSQLEGSNLGPHIHKAIVLPLNYAPLKTSLFGVYSLEGKYCPPPYL